MQADRTAGESSSPAPASWIQRAQGLGVSDVLRIELEPRQVPGLLEEVGALRDVFERELVAEIDALEAISPQDRRRETPQAVRAQADVDARTYQLRALAVIARQLADAPRNEPVCVFGPSRLISELVGGATQNVVGVLGDRLDAAPRDDTAALEELVETAEAARAWVEAWVACRRVEWFSFDPDFDPVVR
jgi:hypothetical protein